jgi:hypothetical protein
MRVFEEHMDADEEEVSRLEAPLELKLEYPDAEWDWRRERRRGEGEERKMRNK